MAGAGAGPSSRRNISIAMVGICLAILAAVVVAAIVHLMVAFATYALNPQYLLLAESDIGPQYGAFDGGVDPTQRTLSPMTYQQQFVGGRLRIFQAPSVLSPEGLKEIGEWEQQHGFTPTTPPTIIGSFVQDHSGIFEVENVELSYATTDAAHHDYACCQYNRADNFHHYQTLRVQLGDEADAFTGIRAGPTDADDNNRELVFFAHWRRGPIVSTIWILGAHDITFDQLLGLARVVEKRISKALNRHTTGSAMDDTSSDSKLVSGPLTVALLTARRDLQCRLSWTRPR